MILYCGLCQKVSVHEDIKGHCLGLQHLIIKHTTLEATVLSKCLKQLLHLHDFQKIVDDHIASSAVDTNFLDQYSVDHFEKYF